MAASATRSSKLLALWLCCALPLIMSSTAAGTTTATTPAVQQQPQPTAAAGAGEGQCRASSDDLDGGVERGSCRYDFQEDTRPHEEYVPAAEVASALPVPIPDGNPVEGAFTNGGLGGNQAFFPGSSGYGTAAGLGAGGFGPYGGYGGGPGTYGYNGPLYFGSAPTRTGSPAGSCAAAAVLLLLSAAAMYI
uniref:Uncharacterized protein n=1 Tax=Oryza rufipogon TaxID=4529 RepID=A0A0E0RKC7_ORYRU